VLNDPQMVRYLQALRMCQMSGTKLGHRSFLTCRVCVAYVLDGKVWEFWHGVAFAPQSYDSSVWRVSAGEHHDLRRVAVSNRFNSMQCHKKTRAALHQTRIND